jgi:hypothetical protein
MRTGQPVEIKSLEILRKNSAASSKFNFQKKLSDIAVLCTLF